MPKPIRHETVINKLACYGFEAAVDPDNPDQFVVIETGEPIGSWRRRPNGNAIRMKVNGKCHGTARAFVDQLKKVRNPNRTMN